MTAPRAGRPPGGRASTGVPPLCRRATRAAAVLALAALTFAAPGPAEADRHYPSAGRVAESKAAVASQAQQVGQIEAQLASASARAAALAVEVAQAVEAYNGARYRLEQAVVAAHEAQRRADTAKTEVARCQRELGAFAAAAYRSGGDLAGLSAFLTAEGPRDMISRASALGSIGASRENSLDRLRSAQALVGVLQTRATNLVTKRRSAARAVQQAKRTAEGKLAGQQQAVGQISAQRIALVRALAKARHTSVRLEQARQRGIEAERRAAAARAAAARAAAARAAAQRRAEAAAREARAARAQADREARDRADRAARDTADRAAREREASQAAASSSGNGGGNGGASSSGGNDGASSTPSPPAGSSVGSGSGAQGAISFATAQIGKPYVWAADGPSSFDCSGLTMRAWQQGGVSLPHYSVAQYEQSAKVGLGELRPGDLVFFASGSSYTSIYHVGLYIGGGEMIEAPYTGETVRVSSIYRSSLFGAARP